MTSSRVLALFVALALMLGACSRTLDVPVMVPETLQQEFVPVTTCALSQHPAHEYVVTWVSKDAEAQWRSGKGPLPQGAVLVKSQYKDARCTELARYTVMRKGPPGTAPASGDWIWQHVDRKRGVRQHGQLAGCINCHKVCEDEEYVCTWPAPPEPPAPAPTPPLPDGF